MKCKASNHKWSEPNGAIYVGIVNAHFNRFVNNQAPQGGVINNENGTVDASLNWWGSNNDPSENVFEATVTPWLVLRVTSNPITIFTGKNSTVTVDLLYDSGILTDPNNPNLYYHNPSLGHVPDGISVNFIGDALATVNPLTNTTEDGITSTTLTGNVAGVSHPEASVDDSNFIPTTVNIEWIPTMIVVKPVSGFKGDIVDLIVKLTDTHNNIPLAGQNVHFSVNGSSVGTATTNALGTATLQYTITQTQGVYTILANFLQDSTYTASSNTNTLKVGDKTPFVVTSSNPVNNAVNVALNKVIQIRFNEAIKLGTNPWIEFFNSDGTGIKFTTRIVNNVLSITPNSLLTLGTTYHVVLHSNSVTDLYGGGLSSPYAVKLTTTKPIVVKSTNPINNSRGASLTSLITVKFDTNIAASINYSLIYVKNITTGQTVSITKSISGSTLTIKTNNSRLHQNVYQVFIPAGAVKNTAGTKFAADYSFRFKTEWKNPLFFHFPPLNITNLGTWMDLMEAKIKKWKHCIQSW